MSEPTFKDQDWKHRYQGMGDQAEKVFEEVFDKGFTRWGLQRPPIQVHRLPRRIRYAPDYLTTRHFVEVQGFGRDQIVKLKLDKYDALRWWNVMHPVLLFLYDSANVRYTFVELEEVTAQLEAGTAEIRKFPEGHAYYAFPAEVFFSEESDATT